MVREDDRRRLRLVHCERLQRNRCQTRHLHRRCAHALGRCRRLHRDPRPVGPESSRTAPRDDPEAVTVSGTGLWELGFWELGFLWELEVVDLGVAELGLTPASEASYPARRSKIGRSLAAV